MHPHAILLADIAILDGNKISQNDWSLISGNVLREEYEWPLSPSEFMKYQIAY